MPRDARGFRNRLHAARQRLKANQPVDVIIRQVSEQLEQSIARLADRRARIPKPTYDELLPIARHREDIARAIEQNPVVVVCGDTGSGKTTQLPKILLELGRGVTRSIGHTQPRRIAARSVAQRISDELNVSLGDVVGFKVRFTDQTSPTTLVKLMTDGILLAETQNDPLLDEYDTLIIDEAHERSLNIDFLLGYIKQLLPRRPDLKVVITSATIDPERFSKHFDDAPIIMVEGRTYPVEVRYRPPMSDDPEDAPTLLRDGILSAVDECFQNGPGDVLVFLPGEREIRETAESLGAERRSDFEIVPLYARLGVGEQMRVFQKHGKPRIVLATNVAETSLTVPGIRYVIDTGVARVSRYSPRSRMQRLPIERISQASANQRKGRCGRVGPGVCVRLYSEADFLDRPAFTDPEILRTNLSSVILQMKAYRLGRIEEFPFIEPPDYRQVRDGYQSLFELGALDENNELTDLGRLMARLPIDPKVSRMIVAARDLDCLGEVLVIASALSVQDPRDRPMDKQSEADAAHAKWRVGGSDFLGYVNLWDFYHAQEAQLGSNRLRKMCIANFISYTRMREWQDVHRQLVEIASDAGWQRNREQSTPERIHQALLAGLLSEIGRRGEQAEYQGVRGKTFWLFPGSALFHRKPAWVMAAEIVETTKPYARIAAEINPDWIEHVAAHLVKRTYAEPHWQRKTGRVMAHEKVMLHGLLVVPKRTVPYEQIDPKTSREIFIQSALVDQDVDLDAPFFRHNANLLREIELLEARTRRRDILVDVRTRYAYYDARIPAEVTGLMSFNRWRRIAGEKNKRLLFMEVSDLMMRSASDVGVEQFPNHLDTPAGTFPLSYHFEPGHPDDGVTLTIPLAVLNQINADQLDWLVPGLIDERCLDLIKTLPKQIRVNVVPAPDYASRAVRLMEFGKGNLQASLAATLGKLTGMTIREGDFVPGALQDYLRMNVRVIDGQNKLAAQGRDVHELRKVLRDKLRELVAGQIDPKWHRDGLTTWDVGDLPERVEVKSPQGTLQAFPGLIDLGTKAGLRLFDTPEAARASTRGGVRRLFVIEYAKELAWHVGNIPGFAQMALHYAPLASSAVATPSNQKPTAQLKWADAQPAKSAKGAESILKSMMVEALAHLLITPDAADVRSRMEYEFQLRGAWNRLAAESKKLSAITSGALVEFHQANVTLSTRKFPELLQASADDVRQQLRALLPADFLLSTPKAYLDHLPRYLKAINVRLEKLLNAGVKRDADCLLQVAPRWQNYLDLKTTLPKNQPEPEVLVRYRWLLEELRVSLYAQTLGTSTPVSPKRIDEAWTEVMGKLKRNG